MKSNCTFIDEQSAKKSTIILVQHCFSIGKQTTPEYQNTLTFYQYPFNSRSNVHVNWVYGISLHPKKAIIPTFSGQTPNFPGKNFGPKVGGLTCAKSGAIIC